MDNATMFQCELRKGRRVHHAWLDARGAWVGAVVVLDLGNGIKDPGWRVVGILGSLPQEQLTLGFPDFKYHRARILA